MYARAAALQTGSPPSRGLHLIGSIQPVRSIRAAREDCTRSVGVDFCRSGVSPHRTQASSRSWPPVTLPPLPATPFRRLSAPALPAPVQQGPVSDAFPAFIGAPPGSPAPVRERTPVRAHDARGNGGGFAPLGALLRRVVSVSWLYWCNSPRLAVPSTWAELDRAPLTAQFPPFGGGEVTVRDGEVTVRSGVAPKVQTTSAKNADNGVSWTRWSTFWAQRRLASPGARTRTAQYAR